MTVPQGPSFVLDNRGLKVTLINIVRDFQITSLAVSVKESSEDSFYYDLLFALNQSF